MTEYEPTSHEHTLDSAATERLGGTTLGSTLDHQSQLPPAQTSHRPDYWEKPTADQVAHAAKLGFDLTKQAKYYR